MPKPDKNEPQGSSDEMFDFLDENSARGSVPPSQPRRRRSFDMPIIRTPVPVAQSGPVRVEPNALAEEPDYQGPIHTTHRPVPTRAEWDEDIYADDEHSPSGVKKYATVLFAVVLLAGAALAYTVYVQMEPTAIIASGDTQPVVAQPDVQPDLVQPAQIDESGNNAVSDEVAQTDVTQIDQTQADSVASNSASVQTAEVEAAPVEPIEPPKTLFSRFNEQVLLLENLLAEGQIDEAEQTLSTMDRAVYGYGATEFANIEQRIAEQRAANGETNVAQTAESELQSSAVSENAASEQAQNSVNESTDLVSPLPEEQRLSEAQQLAEEQRLAEAKRILDQELATEQAKLAETARAAEQARLAEAQQAAEQARLDSEARAAEQAQLLVDQAREAEQAQEQARLEEQARLQEQARLEEQARAEEEARLAESASVESTEQARLAERARLAEQSRQVEQARIAEAERVAAQRQADQIAANLAAQQPQVVTDDSLALATAKAEDRISEERARLERQREADAQNARREAQEQESERIRAEEDLVKQQAGPNSASVAITDDDFNFVAGKFVELKTAVTNRDINSVIALTKPSGKRIQQMLQIFENSSSVQARVSNVATRNADGVIVGQLKIQKLVKNSGAEATVPANLSSITLTSERGPEGWSAIAW